MNDIGISESCSMDYNDEVGSAPSIMVDASKANKRSRIMPQYLGLKMTLSLLLATVVGLAIAVGTNGQRPGVVKISKDINEPNVTRAIRFSEELNSKLLIDSGYTQSDAERDYLTAFNEVDKDAKIFVALEYADFLSTISRKNDAIDFLQKEKDEFVSDGYGWLNYYVTLANLYLQIGDQSSYDYYVGMYSDGGLIK